MKDSDFVQLINDFRGIIHKVCHSYCQNIEDFKDLQQEIILQVWKSLPSFKNNSKTSTWFYKVALNTALNYKRKNAKLINHNEFPEESILIEEDRDDRNEKIQLIYEGIRGLKSLDRAIILLYLEEKSYVEISEITGFPQEQIGMKLSRVKKKLKKQLMPIINEIR